MHSPQAPAFSGSIAPPDRTGRIGVMYFRGLLAQAGIPNSEGSPGEDFDAVDLDVRLTPATVRVQVKAGLKRLNQDDTYSVRLSEQWCAKWAHQKIPVFLVLVVLSARDYTNLVAHGSRQTTWHLHAYWVQVNDAQPGSVRVPVQNRLELETFVSWEEAVNKAFRAGSA